MAGEIKQAVASGYQGLPNWAKTTIFIGGVVVVYLVYRRVSAKIKADINAKYQKALVDASANEVKNLYNQGVVQTLTNSQLEGIASNLRQAFDGCGTDWSAITRSFEAMKNEADLQALIRVYGIRKYDACNWEFDFGDKELNLAGAISDECSGEEVDEINGILKRRGIKYRF
jgi:hypothetical protein